MIHPFERTRLALIKWYSRFKPSVQKSLAAQRALEDGAGKFETPNLHVKGETKYLTLPDGNRLLLRIFIPRELTFSTEDGPKITEDWRGTILFFHGGGWVSGNTELYADPCADLAHELRRRVVSVEYRRAPEHRFPTAAEDCYFAAKELFAGRIFSDVDPEKVILMGDSAGGNLCAVVSLMARDRGDFTPRTQVLLYPALNNDYGPDTPFYSVHANGQDFMLTAKDMVDYIELYAGTSKDLENPYFAPLLAKDNARLPRTLILSAELCPLRDEDEYYAHLLWEAGNDVSCYRLLMALHGYLLSPIAAETIQNTYKLLRHFLDREPLPSQRKHRKAIFNTLWGDYGWLTIDPKNEAAEEATTVSDTSGVAVSADVSTAVGTNADADVSTAVGTNADADANTAVSTNTDAGAGTTSNLSSP